MQNEAQRKAMNTLNSENNSNYVVSFLLILMPKNVSFLVFETHL